MGPLSSRTARLFALFALLVTTSPSVADDATGDAPRVIAPLGIDKRLIAYWRFDEPSGTRCGDSGGDQYDAATDANGPGRIERHNGVFSRVLFFSGPHMLRAEGKPRMESIQGISLSAWIMSTDLGGLREIFRKEDGDNRILFSFQHGGTILALGLNVGGYVECDARIHPENLLDGRWHHCAATYDPHGTLEAGPLPESWQVSIIRFAQRSVRTEQLG